MSAVQKLHSIREKLESHLAWLQPAIGKSGDLLQNLFRRTPGYGSKENGTCRAFWGMPGRGRRKFWGDTLRNNLQ